MMILRTGISPTYVKDWGAQEAIRELFQNYLDSREEFDARGRVDWRGGKGTLHDYGPGIEPRHLAIGVSEKQSSARGQFGEGLKLALLVFAREGREIVIRSQGKEIRPSLEYDEGFATEILVLHIQETKTPAGTQIRFACTREEWDRGKDYFIEFRQARGGIQWVGDNVSRSPGEVWVNKTLVYQNLGSLFGYHIDGREGVNRDRSVVDINKISYKLRGLLGNISDPKAIDEVFEGILEDSDAWEIQEGPARFEMTAAAAKRWCEGFYRAYGKGAILASGVPELDNQLDHNGFRVISMGPAWKMALSHAGVKTAQEAARKVAASKKVTRGNLSDVERKNLDTAITLVSLHYAEPRNVEVVEQIILNPDNPAASANGAYCRSGDRIELAREILQTLPDTVKTLLHETVHQNTGLLDRTSEFQDAAFRIAASLMLPRNV